MVVIRRLSHSPDLGIYEVMTRTEHGDHYSAMTGETFSDLIRSEPDPVIAERTRALRRLAHRYPWTWIPATAADGRMN